MGSAIDKKVYKLINLLPTTVSMYASMHPLIHTSMHVSMDGSIWSIWVTTIVVAALVWVVGVVVE